MIGDNQLSRSGISRRTVLGTIHRLHIEFHAVIGRFDAVDARLSVHLLAAAAASADAFDAAPVAQSTRVATQRRRAGTTFAPSRFAAHSRCIAATTVHCR